MKCDIISFDYLGFGDTKEKIKGNSLTEDGEDALNFTIAHLKYKIENIILLGKGIGAMPSIHLASMNIYQNCKSLILCMPLINLNRTDIKEMRSIICKSLIIYEVENKEQIEDDDMIYLCREIPNEKEWFPIKKKKQGMFNNFPGIKKFMDETNISAGHYDKSENKNINFEEVNEIKNEEKVDEKKLDIFNQSEIQIHNDDY